MKKNKPLVTKSIRFDKDLLLEAKRLRVDIAEICRISLLAAVEHYKKVDSIEVVIKQTVEVNNG